MDVHMGILFLHVGKEVQILVDREGGVMPALQEDLDASGLGQFIELLVHLLMGDDIAVGILAGPVEGAELAVDVADVRVIDVAINDIGNDLIPLAAMSLGLGDLPSAMGKCPQLLQGEAV